MKFKELLEKVPDDQAVEMLIAGAGEVSSDSCTLASVLKEHLLDAEVVDVNASNDCLRIWVRADVCSNSSFEKQEKDVSGTPAHGWISVSDRLPKDDELVLVAVSGKIGDRVFEESYELATCYLCDDGAPDWLMWDYTVEPGDKVEISFWHPLPEPWGVEGK